MFLGRRVDRTENHIVLRKLKEYFLSQLQTNGNFYIVTGGLVFFQVEQIVPFSLCEKGFILLVYDLLYKLVQVKQLSLVGCLMFFYGSMQYDIKLLAVDIPTALEPEQRLFLVGDEQEYRVGGGLISELRDPVLKAMAATKEFDDLDEIEEEEDAKRELEEAEKKRRQEIEKLEKAGRD